MTDWGFPNFDRMLDEPSPGPQTPRHLIEWRQKAEASARVCLRFQPEAHTQEWCKGCSGPKYAHSILAVAKGAA